MASGTEDDGLDVARDVTPKERSLRVKGPAGRDSVEAPTTFLTWDARLARGRALRQRVPRTSHAEWKGPSRDRDPVEVLERSNAGRMPELVPIRIGRMLASPFAFFRGSAGLMAHDLGGMASTGVRAQVCGDCHLLNFGLFASPERSLVFDLNDFDETLPGAWEWDVLRLASSIAVAARANRLSDAAAREAAASCVRSYREHLREYSRMSPLEVWYTRLDADSLIELAPSMAARKRREKLACAARRRVAEALFPRIAEDVGGRARFVDEPPYLFHVPGEEVESRFLEGLEAYRSSLPDERRVLLDRYRLEDFAMKVVGIGSVGTLCAIGLFRSEEGHPLILQLKEASRSVLAPHAPPSVYENEGQRVVIGQRLMQSSSDVFLGWARGRGGRDFYVRQLRDMKLTVRLDQVSGGKLERYGAICGWSLARAHAKSGDAATISGYLGKSDRFDDATAAFALRYADQTERDHAELAKAVRSGRVEARIEPSS